MYVHVDSVRLKRYVSVFVTVCFNHNADAAVSGDAGASGALVRGESRADRAADARQSDAALRPQQAARGVSRQVRGAATPSGSQPQ